MSKTPKLKMEKIISNSFKSALQSQTGGILLLFKKNKMK